MRPRDIERVPAHVRDFQVRVPRHDAIDLAGDPAKPSVTSYSRPRSAKSCMPTQMPKNGRPLCRTASSSAPTMPSTASRPRRQSAKAPTPGSTTRSAFATTAGSLVTTMGWLEAGLVRGAFERFCGRVQVTGAVIDDRNAHRRAPGSGKSPITSGASGATPARRRRWRRSGIGATAIGRRTFSAAARRRRSAARHLRDRRR